MKGAPFIQGTPSGTVEESVFPSLCRSLWRGRLVLVVGAGPKCSLIPDLGVGWWCGALVFWRGRLVLVVGVGSKCFLIPGLLAWTLVWVGDVGCWRGNLKLRRGDSHPCEVPHCNQCSDLQ